MKKIFLLASLAVSSSTVLSANDYSNCAHGLATGRIDSSGAIVPREGMETIEKKKQTPEGMEVTFKSTDPRSKEKETILFKTDKNGRITGFKESTDYSKLSKKEKNQIKYNEAYRLANGYYPNECISETITNGSSQATRSSGDCFGVFVFDGDQKFSRLSYESINKSNFDKYNIGMSWDEFSRAKKEVIKIKDSKKKVAEAYVKLMDKQGWLIPTGSEATFKFSGNECHIEKVDQLLFNTTNNTVMNNNEYNAERCDQVMPALENATDDLKQCAKKEKEMVGKIFNVKDDSLFFGLDSSYIDGRVPATNADLITQTQLRCSRYNLAFREKTEKSPVKQNPIAGPAKQE